MSYYNEVHSTADRSWAQSMPAVSLEDAQKVPPGWFAGTGDTLMRGLAETGRAVDLAGSIGPIAQDFFTGGTEHQDRYFREHDDVFNNAVDYWTPKPESVHWSGQVLGGVLASVAQFTAGGPGLMVASQQLGTSEDLVRQGVDANTANLVGTIEGAAAAVGIKAPFVGSTWARKALSGVGVNVPLGITSRFLPNRILEAQGYEEQAKQFQALDKVALATDILMPLVFSGIAHAGESKQIDKQVRQLSEPEKDAVLVVNQAKHLELDTLPGIPANGETLNAHVAAMTKAADQLLRGEPVDVTPELAGAEFGSVRDTGMLVFHGSGAKFDRFSLDFAGSGEGTNAYGEGLYFAEDAGIAQHYRRVAGDEGHLYEVALKASPDDFLIWDKKLSEQPTQVKTALTQAGIDLTHGGLDAGTRIGADLYGAGHMFGGEAQINKAGMPYFPDDRAALGAWFAKNGIPGIRFLDAKSRDAGAGHYNVVLFDPARAEIVSLDGQPVRQPPKLMTPEQPESGRETAGKRPGEQPGVTASPELKAAQQRLAQGDLEIVIGVDENGQPIRQKASEALAEEPSLPAKAFQAAVTCFLGGA